MCAKLLMLSTHNQNIKQSACINDYMNFIFKGEIIDYNFYQNKNKPTIIFLHGWGGNKFSFIKIINLLKNKFSILTLTMPTIQPMSISWNLFDYSNLILELCKLYNIKSCIIVCHSFGLRVATLLKENIKVEKIIITGGAGMKKFKIYKKIEQNNNKILLKNNKFKFLFSTVASKDYLALSNINKIAFKNVVNFVTNHISKFDCPIFLFWGKVDSETKIWIAKKLKKVNKNCTLKIVKSDHFAYLKKESEFNNFVVRNLCF